MAARYVDVDEHRVLIVAGASAGFTLAFLTLFDPGTSRVGVIEPGYPCYRNVLAALGIEPVAIPVDPANRWAPTIEQLEAAGDLDGLIIASPSNPTGTVYDDATLAMIASHCRRRGIADRRGRDLPRHHLPGGRRRRSSTTSPTPSSSTASRSTGR